MRAVLGIAIAAIVAFLFLSFGVYESLDKTSDQYLSTFFTKVIPPLVASFAGAFAAYSLALKKDQIAESSKHANAGNFAIFKLHHMYTVLTTLQKNYIDLRRADPDRWLLMDTPAPGFVREISFDMEQLSFFLNHPSQLNPGAQLLSDLLFIGELFRSIVGLLDERGRVIGDEVLPELRKITVPGATAPQAVASFLPAQHRRLVGLTDSLVTRVDELKLELEKTYPRLKSSLTFLLPHGQFIDLKFP